MEYAGVVKSEFEERVLEIKRVSKKTKGGNKIGFTALVVVGNRNGKVGGGLGKATDVKSAIRKGINIAKNNLIEVSLKGQSIPHEVSNKFGSTELYMKPAPVGSGIIAGGVIRHVVDLAGIKDISAKMLGASNKTANVYCALEALEKLRKA
jgi:small subunit ribosomal protein S5